MKKIFFIIIFSLTIQTPSLTDDIRDFQIEGMSIGDSALDYFSEAQLEDNEQGWHNYNYREYSTSLLPGEKIYHWLQITYKNDDDNFTIEALAGVLERRNYNSKKCNNELDVVARDISELFENTKQKKKQTYELAANASRKYPFNGKSVVTNMSFDFLDKGSIVLECYNMDKATKRNDSFRTDVRSRAFTNYLNKINL